MAGLLVVVTAACGPEETKVATKSSAHASATRATVPTTADEANSIEDSLPFASTASTVKQATVPTTARSVTTAEHYVAPTKATYVPPPTSPPATSPPAPQQGPCHPSYTPCIPDEGTDVDCAGGSGNGPRYVNGPVDVHGTDEYRLDADSDGVGCEN